MYFHEIYLLEAFTPRTSNFERPFTPRTSLRSASNFGKTRFRRFATFDFSTPKKKNRRQKKIVEALFFFKNCFFWKIWPSKSGYRHLRRPKSLPRMRFSSLYDASPARTINFCVLLLDFGRKKTSHMREGPTKNQPIFFEELFFFEDLN